MFVPLYCEPGPKHNFLQVSRHIGDLLYLLALFIFLQAIHVNWFIENYIWKYCFCLLFEIVSCLWKWIRYNISYNHWTTTEKTPYRVRAEPLVAQSNRTSFTWMCLLLLHILEEAVQRSQTLCLSISHSKMRCSVWLITNSKSTLCALVFTPLLTGTLRWGASCDLSQTQSQLSVTSYLLLCSLEHEEVAKGQRGRKEIRMRLKWLTVAAVNLHLCQCCVATHFS